MAMLLAGGGGFQVGFIYLEHLHTEDNWTIMMILPLVTSLIALHLIQPKRLLIETEEKKPERQVDAEKLVRYIKKSGRLLTCYIYFQNKSFTDDWPYVQPFNRSRL